MQAGRHTKTVSGAQRLTYFGLKVREEVWAEQRTASRNLIVHLFCLCVQEVVDDFIMCPGLLSCLPHTSKLSGNGSGFRAGCGPSFYTRLIALCDAADMNRMGA